MKVVVYFVGQWERNGQTVRPAKKRKTSTRDSPESMVEEKEKGWPVLYPTQPR